MGGRRLSPYAYDIAMSHTGKIRFHNLFVWIGYFPLGYCYSISIYNTFRSQNVDCRLLLVVCPRPAQVLQWTPGVRCEQLPHRLLRAWRVWWH